MTPQRNHHSNEQSDERNDFVYSLTVKQRKVFARIFAAVSENVDAKDKEIEGLKRELNAMMVERDEWHATADRNVAKANSLEGQLTTAVTPLKEEVERLRNKNSELHRRAQQSEAAVKDTVEQWKKHGGPKGGSFGRALLACECQRLSEQLTASQERVKELEQQLHGNPINLVSTDGCKVTTETKQ